MVDITCVFLEVLGVAPPDEARKATHHVFMHLLQLVNICLSNCLCHC